MTVELLNTTVAPVEGMPFALKLALNQMLSAVLIEVPLKPEVIQLCTGAHPDASQFTPKLTVTVSFVGTSMLKLTQSALSRVAPGGSVLVSRHAVNEPEPGQAWNPRL